MLLPPEVTKPPTGNDISLSESQAFLTVISDMATRLCISTTLLSAAFETRSI